MCCNNKEGHDIIEYLEDIKIREYKNYLKKMKNY